MIASDVDGDRMTIRLIGDLHGENLAELATLVEERAGHVALDLKEVNRVDVAAIGFLVQCDRCGVPLMNCPPYVERWIAQEQSRDHS